jgi:hypothetical protein
MTLESSVTVFENDDLVSFDKESKGSAIMVTGRLRA